ncbi:MAG: VCBS repeat-containing protein [Acidobacteriota bacterium]|nr:VCBS repeat-containing protein [Acidobacteriota bacterium]
MKNYLKLCYSLIFFVTVTTIGAQTSLNKILDYDDDNKTDLVVFRPSENVWYAKLSRSGGLYEVSFGVSGDDFLTPGNYDTDTYDDIGVWRNSEGNFYFLKSTDGTMGTVHLGSPNDEPVPRDYDGDSITDFAVIRRENGLMSWYVIHSTTGQVVGTNFGLAIDYAAPGDYDGDGKTDIAVVRPSPNNGQAIFYILGSNVGFYGYPWGLSNDLIVPGDYDGDGNTDLAIVRDTGTNLLWAILNSRDSSYSILSFGIGGGDDFPVQSDYDGDGKTDIAVWRNSTGSFYVFRSSDGALGGGQFGTDGDYPVAYYDVH